MPAQPLPGFEFGRRRATCSEFQARARTEPPNNTRAWGRGQVLRGLMAAGSRKYVIDWDGIYLDRDRHLDLRNPFHPYEEEACAFVAEA